MEVRDEICAREHQVLRADAAFADASCGRARDEPQCPLRTGFQRDRDRVLHCRAFRRLKHKTQVFLAPEGDHYRTRLTHTLEVAQIARTLARALCLNEDLTEAIALAHDLGHTPFGHTGEQALQEVHAPGFWHYEQSVRVVERLENHGRGLNLTFELRNGVACHTRGADAITREGQLVRLADRIAYINHDIEDAMRAGILQEEALPLPLRQVLGHSKSARIHTLVQSCVQASASGAIALAPPVQAAFDELHSFMFAQVYTNPLCKREAARAMHLVQWLYAYFVQSPQALPGEFLRIAEAEGAERAACDYIAGMTDRFAVQVFSQQFVPKFWVDAPTGAAGVPL